MTEQLVTESVVSSQEQRDHMIHRTSTAIRLVLGSVLVLGISACGATESQAAPTTSVDSPGPPAFNPGVTTSVAGLRATLQFGVEKNGATGVRCVVSIQGVGTYPGCRRVTIELPTYSSTFTGSATIQSSGFKPVTQAFGLATRLKTLTADASGAFGTCPGGYYCGPNSHSCSTTAFSTGGCPNPVSGGTVLAAACWTKGSVDDSGTGNSSSVWIRIPGYGAYPWMNAMYFANWRSASANLPQC